MHLFRQGPKARGVRVDGMLSHGTIWYVITSTHLSSTRWTPLARSYSANFAQGHLLLTSVALLPGLLGVAFYLSLALKAHHGEYHNGTYVRPTDEGRKWWRGTQMSPLFISSLSSSTMQVLSSYTKALKLTRIQRLHLRIRNSSAGVSPRPSLVTGTSQK
jgi:hypothetical protein